MAAVQPSIIRSCEELSFGDEIEAWCFGRLIHQGTVSRTLPSVEMFWIVCARTGTRRLVDMEAAAIIRVAAAPGDGR